MEEKASPKKDELKKRKLPNADIYEKPNFGDDIINNQIIELQKAVKDALKDSKNTSSQCLAYNNLGTAYFRLLKYDAAELCFDLHLKLAKSSTSLVTFGNKKKYELKAAMINLGCIYHMKREYELALQTFRDAIDYAEEVSSVLEIV